jgi:hypothetical protein
MYRIVYRERQWIVCIGAAMLLAFDQEEAAIKTVQDAEKLMAAVDAPAPSPLPGFAVRMAEAVRCHSDVAPQPWTASAFVERRQTSRSNQHFEADAAE